MPITTVRVTITVDPADAQTLIDALAVAWEDLSREEDLLYYDLSQDVSNPGKFLMVEFWDKDVEFLKNVQINQPYYGVFWQKTHHLWKGERTIEFGKRLPQFTVLKAERLKPSIS